MILGAFVKNIWNLLFSLIVIQFIEMSRSMLNCNQNSCANHNICWQNIEKFMHQQLFLFWKIAFWDSLIRIPYWLWNYLWFSLEALLLMTAKIWTHFNLKLEVYTSNIDIMDNDSTINSVAFHLQRTIYPP